MKHIFLFIFSFYIIATSAQAELLVEPAVGYNFGKFEFGVDGESDSYNANGASYGGRLGYQKLGFQLGVDYLNSTLELSGDDFKGDLKTSEYAAFAGFEFPIFLRIYAGYIFGGTGEVTGENDDENEYSKASGFKAGFGFTGIPLIDINLEYRSVSWGEVEVNGEEPDESDAKYNSIMLGLSIPLTI